MKEITACRDILIHSMGKYEHQRGLIEKDTQKALAEKAGAERDLLLITQAVNLERGIVSDKLPEKIFPPSPAEMESILRTRMFERAIELFPYNMRMTEREMYLSETERLKRVDIVCEYEGNQVSPETLYRILIS